jgi:hypothetical protein
MKGGQEKNLPLTWPPHHFQWPAPLCSLRPCPFNWRGLALLPHSFFFDLNAVIAFAFSPSKKGMKRH